MYGHGAVIRPDRGGFVLLVARCIGWQKQRLADLNEQLERFDRQISSRIKAVVNQDDALKDIPTGQDEPLPESVR